MLAFDPADRITVLQALEHPYLESYHEIGDEPECPTKFDKWREIEEIESDFDYRKAIWREVYEFRLDVRTLDVEGMAAEDTVRDNEEETEDALQDEVEGNEDEVPEASDTLEPPPHPRESSLELPEAHRHEGIYDFSHQFFSTAQANTKPRFFQHLFHLSHSWLLFQKTRPWTLLCSPEKKCLETE